LQDANEKNKHIAAEEILNFWDRVQCRDAKFFVDGQVFGAEETALKTVREDGAYMADYILGTDGKIQQVRYDRISP
jgi:hypothetical protein